MEHDPILQMAYDASTKALEQQDRTIGNLRNRATAILTVAALGVSFATGVGLINTDRSKGFVLPHWAAFTLLGLVGAMGLLTMYILLPVDRFVYGPDAEVLLRKAGTDNEMDDVLRYMAQELTAGRKRNAGPMKRRFFAFELAVALLVAEVVVLIMAFLLN